MSQRLFTFGLVTFVFNLGGGLIAPALPLYARSLGADYRDLGLIGASHGLAFALLTVPLGRASDRFGRRALLLLSALAVAAAAAAYLLSTRVIGLVAGKVVEAAGSAAFWPALEAWMAEEFARRPGSALGVAYGAYAAAYVLGTSAAGFIIEGIGPRAPFGLYLGTAGLALALVLTMAERAAPGVSAAPAPSAAATGDGTRRGDGGRAARRLAYGTGFVYVFGLGTVLAFLPAYAADRGLAPSAVGLLLGGYWVARFVGSILAGRISDRLGRRAVLVPAMGVSAGAGVLVALPGSLVALAAGTVGLGIIAGACAPSCVGLIADNVRPADRGTAMGLFEAACGVSFLVSGFVGGQAAEAIGPEMPYLLVAALAGAWALVLAFRLPGGGARLE